MTTPDEVAAALAAIRRECTKLLRSESPVVVNFATRVLAEVRTCETQLPTSPPPNHEWDAPIGD
ncbi:MAG: hypothetical protein Q8Q52_06510 [Acidimicrobiia bacterium]|nr:hypothetical protein [Acidimicrobiia bacterium]